jgi:hypothetical protein
MNDFSDAPNRSVWSDTRPSGSPDFFALNTGFALKALDRVENLLHASILE